MPGHSGARRAASILWITCGQTQHSLMISRGLGSSVVASNRGDDFRQFNSHASAVFHSIFVPSGVLLLERGARGLCNVRATLSHRDASFALVNAGFLWITPTFSNDFMCLAPKCRRQRHPVSVKPHPLARHLLSMTTGTSLAICKQHAAPYRSLSNRFYYTFSGTYLARPLSHCIPRAKILARNVHIVSLTSANNVCFLTRQASCQAIVINCSQRQVPGQPTMPIISAT